MTTNMTRGEPTVHQDGLLWKLVRASMTIVGLIPPVYENGELLIDGGYLNNMPVDVMRGLGVDTVSTPPSARAPSRFSACGNETQLNRLPLHPCKMSPVSLVLLGLAQEASAVAETSRWLAKLLLFAGLSSASLAWEHPHRMDGSRCCQLHHSSNSSDSTQESR